MAYYSKAKVNKALNELSTVQRKVLMKISRNIFTSHYSTLHKDVRPVKNLIKKRLLKIYLGFITLTVFGEKVQDEIKKRQMKNKDY